MRRLQVVMGLAVAALLGLVFWKNTYSYSFKTIKWRLAKSLADTTLIVLAAIYTPAMLVVWNVMWLTRFISRRGIQVTLSVILGIILGSVGGIFLELLAVLAVFSVDLLTGSQGIYGWWRQAIPDTFLPSLEGRRAKGKLFEWENPRNY